MNNMVTNRIRTQSVEQKAKQLKKSRERYKEKQSEGEPIISKVTPPTHEDIQREKRLRKRAQRQLQTVQKKLETSKQSILERNQQLHDLEEKTVKLEYERFESHQRLSRVDELEIELARRDQLLLVEQERRKQAEKMIEKMTIHYRKQKDGRNKVDLANQVKQLKESNKVLHKQVENYDLLAWEKYGNMERELKGLRKEVHTFRNREQEMKRDPMFLVEYMKNYISSDYLPELLEMLQSNITTENLHHFYLEEKNVFYLLMRRVNLLKFHSQRRSNQYKLKSTSNSNDLERLGYLSYENDKWLFVDMTQADHPKVYDVLENTSDEPLTTDRPAKATLHQHGVTILTCFSMETPKYTQHKKKHINPPTSKKEYVWFGNFKVLVIGSQFLNEYKNRLEKHGCNVLLHNPFEESYEVLKGKISRSEIILVCERHIPHSIWDYVDKKQPYVNVLKQDSKDLLSTFTYLTLQRCELV